MATTFAAPITAANSPSPSASSYCSSNAGFSPTSNIFQRRPSSAANVTSSSNGSSGGNSSSNSSLRRLSAANVLATIMCGHRSPSSGGSPRSSRKRSFAEESPSIHSPPDSDSAGADASSSCRVKRTRFSLVDETAGRDADLDESRAQNQTHTSTQHTEHELHSYKESSEKRRTWAQEQYAMLGAASGPSTYRAQGDQRFSPPPPPPGRDREESLVYTSPLHLRRREPQNMPTTTAFGGGIHLRFQAIVPSNGATADEISNRFTNVDESSDDAGAAARSSNGSTGTRAQSLAHGRHSMVAVTSFLASRSSLVALPSTSSASSSSSSSVMAAAQAQQIRARIGSLGRVLTSFDGLLERRTAAFGGLDELARGSDELKNSMDGLLRMQEEMKRRNAKRDEKRDER